MGLLDTIGFTKLKKGLAKTRDSIAGKVARLVTMKSTIDDELLEQVEEILIAGDVGVDTTMSIINAIRRRVKEERYADASELNHLLKDEIQRQFANGLAN